MTSVEVVDVSMAELDPKQLWGRRIDFPKSESYIPGQTVDVRGWVLGRSSLAVDVEVVYEGTVVQRVPLSISRPDIAEAFANVSAAEQSGFHATVSVPNKSESELLVQTVLQDDSRVPLGIIRARRHQNREEQDSMKGVQGQSGRLESFFRRMFGKGGG